MKTKRLFKYGVFLLCFLTLLLSLEKTSYAEDASGDFDKRTLGRTDWMGINNSFETTIKGSEGTGPLSAVTVLYTASFDEPIIEKVGEYDRVTISGCESWPGRDGTPVVPGRTLRLLIPEGYEAESVKVTPLGTENLAVSGLTLEPTGERMPLSQIAQSTEPTLPDPEIYESNKPYPALPCGDAFLQTKGVRNGKRFNFIVLALFPLEYDPLKGELKLHRDIRVEIKLRTKSQTTLQRQISKQVRTEDLNEIRRLVDNPEVVDTYVDNASQGSPQAQTSPLDSYEYVVITTNLFRDATGDNTFETLCQSKRDKGITATIVTVEDDIYPNYTGTDYQEKIRNFIIDYYENHETHYILLGGSANEVPPRKLWVEAWPGSSYKTNIPSDSYYGCLDGNYNSDGDGKWGEPTDGPGGGEVDLYAEVFVGRAPVENLSDMRNIVRKTLAYESSSDDYLTLPYAVGEHLGFGGDSQYAKKSMEEIRLGSSMHDYTTMGFEDSPSADFYDTQVLYDADVRWSKSQLINIINEGTHMLNHLGHANYTYDMKLYTSDLSSLTNDKYFFAYSQGCMPGGFDTNECFAEVVTTMEEGAFAAIMNARYGWGMRNSTDGPSQNFHRELWDAIFAENMPNLGRMNQDSKEDNIGKINNECIRWCMYELNLFGDPELEIQTGSGYLLRVSDNPAGSGSVTLDPPGPRYEEGTVVTLTANPSEGYYFGNWSGDIGGSSNPATITMNSEKTVTANFTKYQYDLTVNNGTGSGRYPHGTVVDISVDPPSAGYRFDTWTGDTENIADVNKGNTTITMLDHSTITGNYRLGKYSLAVTSSNGEVAIDPDKPGGYDYGDTATLTPTPYEGYLFINWSGDVTPSQETDNPLTITINDDKDITAHFAIAYRLTVIANNGTVTKNPNRAAYLPGTEVTLTAQPSSGYHFDKWSGDASGSNNPKIIVMDSDKNITAHFEINTYRLNITSRDTQGNLRGNVTQEPSLVDYPHGTVVTLTAKPVPPYFFTEWQEDLTGTDNPETITMDEEKNVTAIYDVHYPQITSIVPAFKPYSEFRDTEIEINGEYFGDYDVSQCKVTFFVGTEEFDAEIILWQSNLVKCMVPVLPVGTHSVKVFNAAGGSNAYPFSITQVVPRKPLRLEAVALSQSSIKLKWIDDSSNEDGFKIERSINSAPFSVIATVDADTQYYRDTPLAAATYLYRVRAYNNIGYSPYSNTPRQVTLYTGNEPPQYYMANSYYAFVDCPFELEVLVRDLNDPSTPEGTLNYSAWNKPPGATFDNAKHTLNWQPGAEDKGLYEVTFEVRDSDYTIYKVVTIYTCTEEFEEVQITSGAGWEYDPDIYGRKIVWHGTPNISTPYSISMYDMSKNITEEIPFEGRSQYYAAIDGEKIVTYEIPNGGGRHVSLYDLETDTIVPLAGTVANGTKPAVHMDRAVWIDARYTYPEIYMHDLFTAEKGALTSSTWDTRRADASIYKDKISWHDISSGSWRAYVYDIPTQATKALRRDGQNQYLTTDIYRDKLAIKYYRNGPYGVVLYDLTDDTWSYVDQGTAGQYCDPVIYGDRIAWRKGNEVYMYSIDKDQQTKLANIGADVAIYQNKVVYERNDHIYMTNFLACPEIYTISSNQLEPGQIIRITGQNFGFNQGNSQVVFPTAGVVATEIYAWHDTYITCKVPDAVASGDLKVVNAGGESNPIAVTAPNFPPENDVISPSSGEIAHDKYLRLVTSHKDPNGWNDLRWGLLQIRNDDKQVIMYYHVQKNKLYLWDEDANNGEGAYIGGFAPGSANVIENKYCMLHCATTMVSSNTDTLFVYWQIKFYESFLGDYDTRLRTRDVNGLTTRIEKKGTYTIRENLPPQVGDIIPDKGSAYPGVKVTFDAEYSDPDLYSDLKWALISFTNTTQQEKRVVMYYRVQENKLYLYDYDIEEWIGGFAPETAEIIDYKYATLDCLNTVVTKSGNDLDITWSITFKNAFEGLCNVYLRARDIVNNSTAITKRGMWRIGAPVYYNLNVIEGSGDGTYEEWTIVDIVANAPDPGHHFYSWSGDVGNVADTTLPSTTIEMLDHATVEALYEPNVYSLTVNDGTGSGEYNYRTIVNICACSPPVGYHFTHWSGDTEHVADVNTQQTTIEMYDNYEVTANFAIDRHTLQVISINGRVDKNPPGTEYDYGTEVTLTANPNEGYSFVGWSGDLSGTNNPETITMNGDKVVVANFAETLILAKHEIKDDWTGESFRGNGDGRFNVGEKIELKIELTNGTTQTITNATAALRTSDVNVQILDDAVVFPDIPAGESRTSSDYFVVKANESISTDVIVDFDVDILAAGDITETEDLKIALVQFTSPDGDPIMQEKPISAQEGAVANVKTVSLSNGRVYAVWADKRYGEEDVFFNYSVDYGATWQDEETIISRSPVGNHRAQHPVVAADENGNIYVAWNEIRTGNSYIIFNCSEDGGITWRREDIRISQEDYNHDYYTSLSADENGNVYLLWQDLHSGTLGGLFFQYSNDHGRPGSWLGDEIQINEYMEDQLLHYPRLSSDENGNVYVLWYNNIDDPQEKALYFNCSHDYGNDGSWIGQRRLPTPQNSGATPQMCNDENGNVYAVWGGRYNGVYEILFNYSNDYGDTWLATTIKRLDGNESTYQIGHPMIDCTESGKVYVTWQDARDYYTDTYFNYSNDFGANWEGERIINEFVYQTRSASEPQVASDEIGNVYIAWRDMRYNFDDSRYEYGVRFNHSRDGGATWREHDIGLVVDPDVEGSYYFGLPSVTSDEKGNAYVGWWRQINSTLRTGKAHFNYVNLGSPDLYDIGNHTVAEGTLLEFDVIALDDNKRELSLFYDNSKLSDDKRANMVDASLSDPVHDPDTGENTSVFSWTPPPPSSEGLYEPVYFVSKNENNGKCAFEGIEINVIDIPLYTLTVEYGDGDGSYPEGEQVDIFADPAPAGSRFRQWTGATQYIDDMYAEDTFVTMPAQNITVTATYENLYSLTVVNGDGDGSYLQGDVINISADPAGPGTRFKQWTGATQYVGNIYSENTTVTMPAQNITVTATYENIYTLTVVNGDGDGNYPSGTEVTITADDPIGYIFKNWTGDTGTVADVNAVSTTITMLDNYTVTGNTVKLGDVDRDAQQRVTMTDAIQASEYSIGLRELTEDQILAANVDGVNNGRNGVSMTDAIIIAEFAIGLRDSWPVEQ